MINRELCQLLVYLEAPTVIAKTLDLIDQTQDQAQQIALAWALRELRTQWTLGERVRYFRWMNLNALGWSGGLSFSKYLDHLREDAIAGLSEDELAKLGGLIDKPQVGPARSTPVARAPVEVWSVERLLPIAARARTGRDFARGERIYRDALCIDCHRINKQGGGSGPDLTGVGNRFGDRDLLEALLEPSKTVSDQYQDSEVLTADDRLFVGRIERKPNGDVRVWSGEAKEPVEVEVAEIVSIRAAKLSRMPAGLLDSFREEELADLLAYLRSGANAKDAAFVEQPASKTPNR
jgi:putative heme-binding domain-containing protein